MTHLFLTKPAASARKSLHRHGLMLIAAVGIVSLAW